MGVTGFPVWEPTLLGMPGVQEELKLTEAQKKEQAAIRERPFQALRPLRRDVNANDRARFRAAREAVLAETTWAVRENLTAEQRQRLEQIRLQLMGPLVFAPPGTPTAVEANLGTPLPERLQLSEDQVRRIEAINTEGVSQINEAARR